jgi:hypothetical protein
LRSILIIFRGDLVCVHAKAGVTLVGSQDLLRRISTSNTLNPFSSFSSSFFTAQHHSLCKIAFQLFYNIV